MLVMFYLSARKIIISVLEDIIFLHVHQTNYHFDISTFRFVVSNDFAFIGHQMS